ncbi:hypothetical protein JVT61DRAFT_8603 [Boletus reticuloceps]|uniref:Uncharacterized protein n=1 Tax=Boletus reticuloceps TaxID=495285 RepID=A0A8I2YYI7_9AGAM|nr:hypothetical protein JVT61DRAFT_8603 [Boletus reticuloceps]
MQCGIDPGRFSLSSCPSSWRKPSLPVVLDGIYNNPNTHVLVTLTQVSDLSFCDISYMNTPATVQVYRSAPRLVLSAALVILAVSQTLKQSFEMYKATKQWQPNRYMRKLVGDGILYFIVNVVCQIYYAVIPVEAPTNDVAVFLGIFLDLAFYDLIPRFIIGIRELYDRDIHGGFHIDTGFGVVSHSNAGSDTSVSGGTSNSSDLEMGRVHESGLNEDSPIGSRE